MKEKLLESYVKNITKEDMVSFAHNNGIELQKDEIDILYITLKKEWKSFLYDNPTPILIQLKEKISNETYEKGLVLFETMKQKYQSFL